MVVLVGLTIYYFGEATVADERGGDAHEGKEVLGFVCVASM